MTTVLGRPLGKVTFDGLDPSGIATHGGTGNDEPQPHNAARNGSPQNVGTIRGAVYLGTIERSLRSQ